MPFADLHLHPSMKTQFSDAPNHFTLAEDLKPDEVIKWIYANCTELGQVLESQASKRMLSKVNVKLVCIAFYVPEPQIIGNKILLDAVKNNPTAQRYITRSRLESFAKPNFIPGSFIQNEINTIKNFNHPTLGRFNILTKATQYNEADTTTTNVVFAIEGCHGLLNSYADFKNLAAVPAIIKTNINKLLLQQIPIVSVNLTHLCQFEPTPFCTHAFGMQFVAGNSFIPTGYSLSTAAENVVSYLNSKNICIDIKHMSVKARQRLYFNYAGSCPIVCTHAGFTGIEFWDYNDYILTCAPNATKGYVKNKMTKKRGYIKDTAFNTNTIGLFDEDIKEILLSGGIIGISLDKRIIGYTPWDDALNANSGTELLLDYDYYPFQEFAEDFLDVQNNTIEHGEKAHEDYCLTKDEINNYSATSAAFKDLHLFHFINHLLHVMKVAQKYQAQLADITPVLALRQVCIGSDFDGIINAAACCYTAEEFPTFKTRFETFFAYFVKEVLNITLSKQQAQQITEDIFYNNAKRFILSRVTALGL